MADVRIFSYLPNPRVWKAVTAARIGGADLEVRGAAGVELVDWLWDFYARPLSEVRAEERAAAERMGRIGFKGRKPPCERSGLRAGVRSLSREVRNRAQTGRERSTASTTTDSQRNPQ